MDINVKIVAKNDSFVPTRQSDFSAGYDLRAAVEKKIIIPSGERRKISTGIKLEIPQGFEGQVRPRSGLAFKHGIMIVNSPGTIDSDYRGDIGVILLNTGKTDFIVEPGDRIAQITFSPVYTVDFIVTNRLDESTRGEGGFGSTGT